MCKILKRLFGKEEIPEKTIVHASKGDYTAKGRLKGGGHGQEALDYMDKKGIKYNITKTYPNGVRIGNVPKHKKPNKKVGNNQSWFPEDWDRNVIKKAGQAVARGRKLPDGSVIKKAGQAVARGRKLPDGRIKKGKHKHVDVGIIRTQGEIGTIFPLNEQKVRRGKKK